MCTDATPSENPKRGLVEHGEVRTDTMPLVPERLAAVLHSKIEAASESVRSNADICESFHTSSDVTASGHIRGNGLSADCTCSPDDSFMLTTNSDDGG